MERQSNSHQCPTGRPGDQHQVPVSTSHWLGPMGSTGHFWAWGEGTAGSKAASTHPLQLGVVGRHLLPGTQAGTRSSSRLLLGNTEFKPSFCIRMRTKIPGGPLKHTHSHSCRPGRPGVSISCQPLNSCQDCWSAATQAAAGDCVLN